MKKHIFFNALYLLIIVSIVLFGSGTIMLMNECKFYKLYYSTNLFKIILVFLYPISGYIISVILKYKKVIKVVYYAIIPIIPIFIMFSIIKDKKEKEILNNKNIITKGVIIKKERYHMSNFLTISYLSNSNKAKSKLEVKTDNLNKLSLGDTVLLRYNKECEYINNIFKLFPTKEELKKCKNDCYYENGKLIEKFE